MKLVTSMRIAAWITTPNADVCYHLLFHFLLEYKCNVLLYLNRSILWWSSFLNLKGEKGCGQPVDGGSGVAAFISVVTSTSVSMQRVTF